MFMDQVNKHHPPIKTAEFSEATFYTTCHPAGEKKGSAKGKELRVLRINSSKQIFVQSKTGGETQRETTRKILLKTFSPKLN